MPLPIGLPGHNKIKNINFQPFCRDKGPHSIYLFLLDATSVDGEAAILPFGVYTPYQISIRHGFPFFMTLSQNAEF